jgi:drug/metabolite transporter (DMT)-like permease
MLHNKPSQTIADLGLVTVTIFWGSTFILSKIALEHISLAVYLVIRLNLAAIVLTLYALRYRRYFDKATLLHGMILGIFLFLSFLFQIWGIQYTTASKAGFITGLYVVFVPIFAILFFRDKPKSASLVGVGVATFGLYFLSGGDFTALNFGDWLVIVCAVAVSFQVIFTGIYAPKHNIYLLTAVQLSTTALLSLLMLPLTDSAEFGSLSLNIIIILVYLALFGTIYTFLMQTAMQRFTTATRTALVFALEPVFAVLFAFLIAGETLTASGWLGGLLIICGMVIAEIPWKSVFKQ